MATIPCRWFYDEYERACLHPHKKILFGLISTKCKYNYKDCNECEFFTNINDSYHYNKILK
jgi:hypothetical protein